MFSNSASLKVGLKSRADDIMRYLPSSLKETRPDEYQASVIGVVFLPAME